MASLQSAGGQVCHRDRFRATLRSGIGSGKPREKPQMANARAPGVTGISDPPNEVDDGTMIRAQSPRPGPIGLDPAWLSRPQQVLLSPAFLDIVQVGNDLSAPMTRDAFWRSAYDFVAAFRWE
jgi:hypothetical protein